MGGSKATAGVFLNEVLIGQVHINRGTGRAPSHGAKEDSVVGRALLQLEERFICLICDIICV